MSVSLSLPRDRILATELPAAVFGIVNATPDSFWEKSRAKTVESGIERALAMAEQGADCVDIGGESSRPGSDYVSLDEELERVIPLIEGIRARSDVPISVDTRKARVMERAYEAGADILNDISALRDDPEMPALAARLGIPVILMHMQGVPLTMQESPSYGDAVREIREWLLDRARAAREAGIRADRIILDPGIGFGKRHEDNCALIAGLAEIADGGYPVLMALSRKSTIGIMTGRDADSRLAGSLAANQYAIMSGATYVRVHDVAETRDMLKVVQEIRARGIH